MPDEVVAAPVVESPEVEPLATPDFDAEITQLKKRLSGKDAALTQSQRERDSNKAEADRLRNKIAEYEQANMTEVQRLQAERDSAIAEARQAKAEATAAKLARDFPLAAEALGDNIYLADTTRLAEIEARLKATPATEIEPPAPRIDTNSPRKTTPIPSGKRTFADLKAEFASIPMPDNTW